ncbi:hypothetical protein [Dankookia sp. P2]|uniref:hypothetical protein n=1 Tax=Dankookia sp. P2 TaxID=3423955 RepID=UPI003D671BDE
MRRGSRVASRHEDGSVSVVGFIVDITRERSLAAQVQASAKLATLGEMAANLAHELGQPAATMCSGRGQRRPGPAQARRGVDSRRAQAARPHRRAGRADGRADAAPQGLRPGGADRARAGRGGTGGGGCAGADRRRAAAGGDRAGAGHPGRPAAGAGASWCRWSRCW